MSYAVKSYDRHVRAVGPHLRRRLAVVAEGKNVLARCNVRRNLRAPSRQVVVLEDAMSGVNGDHSGDATKWVAVLAFVL